MDISNLRFLRRVSEGGSAEIFLARQDSLARTVVVKVMKENLGQQKEMVLRFQREARMIASLNHPNIVQLIDDGFWGERYFMVLEYLEGGNLEEYIRNRHPTLAQILGLLIPIFSALEFIHSKGIVHRDLKPSNILLDKEGRPKLSDFGISAFLWGEDVRLTRTNTAIGTLSYMAPEQALDAKRVDHRADIYSMGVILYEIVTGCLPQGNFPPPKDISSTVDESFSDAIMRALSGDRLKRFPSARCFRERVETFLAGLAASSAPVGEARQEREEKTILRGAGAPVVEDPFLAMLQRMESQTVVERNESRERLPFHARAEHLELIRRRLDKSSGAVKEALLISLGAIGTGEALEILREHLGDPFYREAAAKAIAMVNSHEAEAILSRFLELPVEKIHRSFDVLAERNLPGLKEKLREALLSESSEIRRTALKAWQHVSSREDLPVLEGYLRRERDPDLVVLARTLKEAIIIKGK